MPNLSHILNKQDYSFTFNADGKTLVAAGLYLLFFCVFEIFYLRADFSDFSNYLNQEQSSFYSLAFVFYVGVSLYLFFIFVVVTISSKWQYQIVCLTIFSAALFSEYGYQKALGRFTNFYDVIAALSATNEQKIDSLFAYANFLALIPCFTLLLFCLVPRPNKTQYGGKILIVLTILNGLFYFHLPYVNQLFFERKFTGVSFVSFCQTIADYALNEPIAQLSPAKRELVETSSLDKNYLPANNIIFVFDESIRGDHLSLNGYPRQTTPYLEKLAARKLLINWGVSVSAATSSHPSYDAMISGATPDMLSRLALREVNSLPTLFQYAKAMNYRTHLFDGQMKRYWGGNAEDVNYIDNFVSLSEIDNPNRIEYWEIGKKSPTPTIKTINSNNGRLTRKLRNQLMIFFPPRPVILFSSINAEAIFRMKKIILRNMLFGNPFISSKSNTKFRRLTNTTRS
jgi:glucan phosphoethanolaminetransferase (alkaline phosphatase superfamily)